MQELFEKINKNYKIRFYKKQKQKFRDFIVEEFKSIGYENINVDESKNIIIGDYENAEVVYSAHYDTPPFSPYITPFTKIFGHYFGMFFSTLFLLPFCIIGGAFIGNIISALILRDFSVVSENYYKLILSIPLFLLILSFAFPNPNNANDNTSGILAVYNVAKKLTNFQLADNNLEEKNIDDSKNFKNQNYAFILFNLEEFGLIGSKRLASNFKKKHNKKPQFKLMNFDCVGVGNDVLLGYKTKEGKDLCQTLEQEFKKNTANSKITIVKSNLLTVASDNLSFQNGILVTATARSVLGRFYLPKIHMPHDSKVDFKTIENISETILRTSK